METALAQPSAQQASAAGALQTSRLASLRATLARKRTVPAPPPPEEAEDAMAQVRTMLDRLFVAKLFSFVAFPVALLLLIARGIASHKSTQSLPLRHIRFTETSWMGMLPNAKKMRPFTFTKRAGMAGAALGLLVLGMMAVIYSMPFLLVVGGIAGVVSALNPLNWF